MGEARERIAEFDLMRWLAIAVVVFIHVSALGIAPHQVTALAVANKAVRFAVPAFVFMAAGLAWGRPWRAGSFGAYLLSRARSVVLPYAAFSLVYSAIALRLAGRPWSAYPVKALANLLMGEAWGHLYFVPVVVAVYLAAPLASRAVASRPLPALLGAWVVAMTAAQWLLSRGPVPAVAGTVLLYAPYAAAGGWYVSRRADVLPLLSRWWPLVLAAGAALTLPRRFVLDAIDAARLWPGVQGLYVNPVDLLLIAGLAGAALAFARRSPRTASVAARTHHLVYGVYLAHPLLVLAVQRGASRVGAAGLLADPFASLGLTVAVLATTVAMVAAAASWSGTAWLVGVRPREGAASEPAAA